MTSKRILPGIKAVGLTLFLEDNSTLVLSDIHLGYEEALNKQGILVPRFQFNEVIENVRWALAETKPETVVINGDLKHEFGRISEQEWKETLRFLDFLNEYDVVLVKGNHDTILGPIATRNNLNIVEEHVMGDVLLTHCNKIPRNLGGVNTIIIGHEHPALTLRDEDRSEKVKCFLVGKWMEKNLVVTPSLNFLFEGTDVTQEKLISPFLQQDTSSFRVYGVEDKNVMDFGELKHFQHH